MKIADIAATWVHVPIPHERQHVSDFGRIASFDSVVVKVETEAGLVGWGEAKAGVGSAQPTVSPPSSTVITPPSSWGRTRAM